MNDKLQTVQHAQATAIDLTLRFGPQLVVALLILAAGRARGIAIPFPQREVRLSEAA